MQCNGWDVFTNKWCDCENLIYVKKQNSVSSNKNLAIQLTFTYQIV